MYAPGRVEPVEDVSYQKQSDLCRCFCRFMGSLFHVRLFGIVVSTPELDSNPL